MDAQHLLSRKQMLPFLEPVAGAVFSEILQQSLKGFDRLGLNYVFWKEIVNAA